MRAVTKNALKVRRRKRMTKVVAANRSVHQVCSPNQTLLNSEIIFHDPGMMKQPKAEPNSPFLDESAQSAKVLTPQPEGVRQDDFNNIQQPMVDSASLHSLIKPWISRNNSGLYMTYPGLSDSRLKGRRNETQRKVIQVPKRI